jgi:4-hydroxybenzoate polyprenyltransferase
MTQLYEIQNVRIEAGSAAPVGNGGQAPPAPAIQASPGVGRALPYLAIARPDHWFKNVFMALGVFLAYFYHPEVFGPATFLSIAWAVLITCLAASSNYVLNEILDAPTDRSHPAKRHRPIPSGKVWLPLAYAEWLLVGALALGLAATLNRPFMASIGLLLVMGMIYNIPPIRAKEHPYIDVLCESINNPIRLLLGWFAVTAAEFPPVSLLISYWMIGAFFMATKRLAEYRSLADASVAGAYRRSFRHYDQEKLLISMFFYTTSFALFLGVFTIRYHLELVLLFPLVAGFVCYYLYVAFKKDSAAQNPERLYRERGLMAYLVLCVVAFIGLMFVHIPALYDWFNVAPSQVNPLWKF